MKAISLLQPWASLVVMGHKKIETRSWDTKYRGEVLIHASKKKDPDARNLALYNRTFYEALQSEVKDNGFDDLPFGSIIGKVNIRTSMIMVDFANQWREGKADGIFFNEWGARLTEQEIAFGSYEGVRYGWLLSDPVKFKKITPVKGSLSIWNFDQQICLMCGCTENNACISKAFGPCWWATKNICSHCEEGVTDIIPSPH